MLEYRLVSALNMDCLELNFKTHHHCTIVHPYKKQSELFLVYILGFNDSLPHQNLAPLLTFNFLALCLKYKFRLGSTFQSDNGVFTF